MSIAQAIEKVKQFLTQTGQKEIDKVLIAAYNERIKDKKGGKHGTVTDGEDKSGSRKQKSMWIKIEPNFDSHGILRQLETVRRSADKLEIETCKLRDMITEAGMKERATQLSEKTE